MSTPPLPPDRDLDLAPVEDGLAAAEPLVSDLNGRLWRVRTRPPGAIADQLLGLLVLLLFAAIGAALVL